MFKKTIISLTLVATALAASIASAAVINSLYNTGVDGGHVVLPDGTLNDPHYTLVSVPSGGTNTYVRDSASGWPLGYPWVGDSTTSAWITPEPSLFGIYAPSGIYAYQTTFDLTGYDPNSVSIHGRWSFDDFGNSVLLNGFLIPFSTVLTNTTGFGGYDLFNITSGFQAGVNTLEFVIRNAGGPTGLRTDFVAEGNPIPAPIPVALLGLGLTGIGLAGRRKSLGTKR